MVRAHLAGAGVVFAMIVACGGDDHAPFIAQAPSTGGKKGAGGAPTVDAGASGGSETEGSGGADTEGSGGFVFGTGGRKTGAGGKRGTGGAGGAADGGEGAGGIPANAPPWTLRDPLDQTDVYFFGQLNMDSCRNMVLARAADPDKYLIGFDCGSLPTRPIVAGKKLYYEYVTGLGIYEFVPDLVEPYPDNAYGNDRKVDTPCTSLLDGFLVTPSGDLIYHCHGSGWFNIGGTTIYSGNEAFTAVTDNMVAATPGLSGSGEGAGVMNLMDGVLHPVPGMGNNPFGFRAHGETFHYVVPGTPPELWSVDASGNVTKLGEFAEPPAPSGPGFPKGFLGSDDAIYAQVENPFDRTLVYVYRARIDGTSDLLFDKADKHPQMYGGAFVTGP